MQKNRLRRQVYSYHESFNLRWNRLYRYRIGSPSLQSRRVVAIAARHPPVTNKQSNLDDKIEFHCCDIANADHVKATIASVRPTQIVHLAAMLINDCEKEPEQAYAVNVAATANILKGLLQQMLNVLFSPVQLQCTVVVVAHLKKL